MVFENFERANATMDSSDTSFAKSGERANIGICFIYGILFGYCLVAATRLIECIYQLFENGVKF
ncbi:hypothetical protein EBR66_05705 [bacterium]|nr:hypothetical protein [bacterium]